MGVVIPQVVSEDRASGAQIVDGGLRFDSGKSQYLTRTPGSVGNRRTWTFSCWVKRGTIGGSYQNILSAANSVSDRYEVYFDTSTNQLTGEIRIGGTGYIITTTQVFRDPSAWYHILVVMDTSQATASNRHKFYVNGTQVTNFASASYPNQDASPRWNAADPHSIGRYQNGAAQYFDGQISNVNFIDGQALGPEYFGYTDPLTNVWRPKKYKNTVVLPGDSGGAVGFGTNGFYLPFDGSAPIGQDQSGRGNNWTPVSFGGSNTIEKATGALPILNTDGGGKVARVGVRTDANASSLVLALPLVGIKSDFSNAINSGTSNKAVTATNAVASSTQSNFYGGSFYFDGNGDYLTFSSSSDFAFGTGDFTVEMWIYSNSTSGTWWDCGQNPNSNNGCAIFNSGGSIYIRLKPGTDLVITSGFTTGRWQHLAVTRNSGTLYCFLNGVMQSTTQSNSSNVTTTGGGTGTLTGYPGPEGTGYDTSGYIQDLRIYKGLAKYTSNFIPASTDPDIVPDSPSGVSYSSNVALVPSTDGAVAFDGTGDYLTVPKTNAWPTGTQDASIEFFLYRNGSGSSVTLFGKDYSGAGLSDFYLTSANVLYFYDNNIATTGGTGIGGVTIAQGKWYHVALTRSGSSLRLFLDGQLIDSNLSASGNWYDSGSISYVMIGARENPIGNQSLNGFISNAHVVFDTALYTSNFTPPTAPISSVANTKLLCCKSNSSATAADVTPGSITANGNAAASNFNPFTVNINTQRGKQSGYCTWNPLATGNLTAIDGNLGVKPASNDWQQIKATISVSNGKWYWESTANPSSTYINQYHGISNYIEKPTDNLGTVTGYCYGHNGDKYYAGSYQSGVAASYTFGDVIGMALDLDSSTQTISFYKNGILQFTQTISGTAPWHPASNCYYAQTPAVFYTNFGQKPFKFPPPAGFQPLTLANTPRPTIVRPDQYVGISTWTGNGATSTAGTVARTLSNLSFKPDLIWVKERTATGSWADHNLTDSVRGIGLALRSNTTDTETNVATGFQQGGIGSGVNNGFTLISGTLGGTNNVNNSGSNYVAWAWKAGGNSNTFNIDDVGYATASAAGLTAGTITPTGASVNTKSGFSIIKVPGTASAASFSHGLGQAPAFVILKETNGTGDWQVGHKSLSSGAWTSRLGLNLTTAEETTISAWNNTPPTSSLITVGATSNVDNNFIVYAWAEIPGFSKFGSYSGNQSSDGNYISCGFSPKFLLIKNISLANTDWFIYDNVRNSYNPRSSPLVASQSWSEGTASGNIDFLSNGFKLRSTNSDINSASSSYTYIYAAFAESPTFNLYGAQANAR